MWPAARKHTLAMTLLFAAVWPQALTAVVNETVIRWTPTTKVAPKAFYPNVILGENYYYIGWFQKVNWHRATQICAYQGLALAQITTSSDNAWLANYLEYMGVLGEEFWLSANDLAESREYSWLTDGSPVRYTNWGRNVSCSCVGHCVRTLPSFKWTVDNCQEKHYFLCIS